MKQVQESLYQFKDAKFFGSLFEEEKLSPAEKKKLANELQKQGFAVVKKCINNFSSFRKHAGDVWQEYRDFWSAQKEADESVNQKGLFYNLWESDYIVGVVKEPNGKAALKVFNTSAADTDEYVAFKSTNPDVVKAFQEFIVNDLQATMKTVIDNQKAAMVAKKAADEARAKEESAAKKKARLDNFLGESEKKALNEARFSNKYKASDIISYARKNYSFPDDIEAVFDGEYGEEMRNSLLQVKNDKEFWEWANNNFDQE